MYNNLYLRSVILTYIVHLDRYSYVSSNYIETILIYSNIELD